MKLPIFFAGNWKKIVAAAIVLAIVLSLVLWTELSPPILYPQTEANLTGSIFQYAKTNATLNLADSEGTYSFLFGMDYNDSLSPGSPTIVQVFVSLSSEQRGSSFQKGVALDILSSTILIDGIEEIGVKSMVTTNGDILTDRLSGIDVNDSSGIHNLSARLIVSTVDVNYIGYFEGSEQVISLNGTLTLV